MTFRQLLLGEYFHQLVKSIVALESNINQEKMVLGKLLYQIQPLFSQPEVIDGYGTFNQFLAEFGKSYSQVKTLIEVGRYLEAYDDEELLLVPITKLHIMAKKNVPMTEELKHELLTLSYIALKDKYEQARS